MAGHSKWNNIKNRKASVDSQRAKVFTELSRLIRSAVKEGGSDDPRFNASLRILLDKARGANMPKEKVQRALDVAMGRGVNGQLKEVVYEGFSAGGLGMIVVAFTNNVNRTASELRTLFSKAGGSLASPGAVKYLFTQTSSLEFVCQMPLKSLEVPPESLLAYQQLYNQLLEHNDVESVYGVVIQEESEQDA